MRMQQPNAYERALAEYLKNGTPFPEAMLDEPEIHQQVEIGILPGYSKSNLDDMWINAVRNDRVGWHLFPDANLKRFFEVLNVHPRDVFHQGHLYMAPCKPAPYFNDSFRDSVNATNAKQMTDMLDLLSKFQTDPGRPAMVSGDTARAIYENAWGGYPLIAGYARISDVLRLDFDQSIQLAGRYQVGIYDSLNGSGHMESAECPPFSMALARRDLIVMVTKGWTPMQTFDFVGKFYEFELSNAKVKETT